jgi:hypothetical protein
MSPPSRGNCRNGIHSSNEREILPRGWSSPGRIAALRRRSVRRWPRTHSIDMHSRGSTDSTDVSLCFSLLSVLSVLSVVKTSLVKAFTHGSRPALASSSSALGKVTRRFSGANHASRAHAFLPRSCWAAWRRGVRPPPSSGSSRTSRQPMSLPAWTTPATWLTSKPWRREPALFQRPLRAGGAHGHAPTQQEFSYGKLFVVELHRVRIRR